MDSYAIDVFDSNENDNGGELNYNENMEMDIETGSPTQQPIYDILYEIISRIFITRNKPSFDYYSIEAEKTDELIFLYITSEDYNDFKETVENQFSYPNVNPLAHELTSVLFFDGSTKTYSNYGYYDYTEDSHVLNAFLDNCTVDTNYLINEPSRALRIVSLRLDKTVNTVLYHISSEFSQICVNLS